MGLGLHKIINSLSIKISILVFNQRLPLKYIFYNFIFRLFIAKQNRNNLMIKNFHENGYSKLNVNVKDELAFSAILVAEVAKVTTGVLSFSVIVMV